MSNRIKTEEDVACLFLKNLSNVSKQNKIGSILGRVKFSEDEKIIIVSMMNTEKLIDAITTIVNNSSILCVVDDSANSKNEWVVGKLESQPNKIKENTIDITSLFGSEDETIVPDLSNTHIDEEEQQPSVDKDLKAYVESLLVDVGDFRISKYQVTQELYEKVMGCNPSYFRSNPFGNERQEKRPVENVSYEDAIDFCKALTKKCNLSSNGFRLPTEIEWSYAANGGMNRGKFKYPGSDNYLASSWSRSTADGVTHEVGLKKRNVIIDENNQNTTIYDMGGNVWEWCQPQEENSSIVNCYGGSFAESELSLELGSNDNKRSYSKVDKRNNIGFRICVNK